MADISPNIGFTLTVKYSDLIKMTGKSIKELCNDFNTLKISIRNAIRSSGKTVYGTGSAVSRGFDSDGCSALLITTDEDVPMLKVSFGYSNVAEEVYKMYVYKLNNCSGEPDLTIRNTLTNTDLWNILNIKVGA